VRVAALFASCGFLVIASAASAQVTGVVTEARATLQFDPLLLINQAAYMGQNEAGLLSDEETSTGAYVVTSETAPNYIIFANGATASGGIISVTTTTSIAVTFTNDGSVAVLPQLVSSIDPGGLGLYLANQDSCDIGSTAACPQAAPGVASFSSQLLNPDGSPTALGGASVSLTISDDAGTLDSLSAGIELDETAKGPLISTRFSSGALGLQGFGLSPESDGTTLEGYQWGATDLLINFPSVLAPGASDTLTYTTTVTSYVSDDCEGADGEFCGLVAYAGFGDPIGKGGGGGNVRSDAITPFDAPSGVDGVGYTAYGFALPTFRDGTFSLPPVTLPPGTVGGVPEPATWGLMLSGMALVGAVLRRRSPRALA
jgi:hypothetical protein